MNDNRALEDRAARDPGVPQLTYYTSPDGSRAGITVCLGITGPRGEIFVQHTSLPFDIAAELRDNLSILLDDIDYTADIDIDGPTDPASLKYGTAQPPAGATDRWGRRGALHGFRDPVRVARDLIAWTWSRA